MENVISNAERRAIHQDEKLVVPRIGDVYAALPAITGKLELEYEGEMKGADTRQPRTHPRRRGEDSTTRTSRRRHAADRAMVRPWRQKFSWLTRPAPRKRCRPCAAFRACWKKLSTVGVGPKDSPEVQVSAAEFILEGLHAHKRIGRNEERVFTRRRKAAQTGRETF